MNNKANELWQQIYPTTHAPRQALVAYIKALCEEAGQLLHEDHTAQATKGWKNDNPRRDEIISSIIHAIAMQDWVGHDTADDLEELLEIASSLEINHADVNLWQKLITHAKQLH